MCTTEDWAPIKGWAKFVECPRQCRKGRTNWKGISSKQKTIKFGPLGRALSTVDNIDQHIDIIIIIIMSISCKLFFTFLLF